MVKKQKDSIDLCFATETAGVDLDSEGGDISPFATADLWNAHTFDTIGVSVSLDSSSSLPNFFPAVNLSNEAAASTAGRAQPLDPTPSIMSSATTLHQNTTELLQAGCSGTYSLAHKVSLDRNGQDIILRNTHHCLSKGEMEFLGCPSGGAEAPSHSVINSDVYLS
jgi:hypothetical protein